MGELNKLVASQGGLRKQADNLAAQLADIDARLTKLESKEDWPGFCGAAFRAPGVANLHRAPERIQ
jgi:hypothetical protein